MDVNKATVPGKESLPSSRPRRLLHLVGFLFLVMLFVSAFPGNALAADPRVEPAVAWAMTQYEKGSHAWDGWCLTFAHDAYHFGAGASMTPGFYTPQEVAEATQAASRAGTDPPRGAWVFYEYGDVGHVGMSLGDGTVIHARNGVEITPLSGMGLTYVGWSAPPMEPALTDFGGGSESFVITQLTSNSSWDREPKVSGDRVVWEGYDGSDFEIFTWTSTGEVMQLTSNSHDDFNPQVSGDRVVWRGYDGSDYEIFTWTPTGEVLQLASNGDSWTSPQVSGDRVVWVGSDGSDYEIFTWTPAGGVLQLNSDSYDDYNPQVSGDRVVWVGSDGSDSEIFTWTSAGGVLQLTSNSYADVWPLVSGDRVVWAGYDGSDSEIFTWTPTGEVMQLTPNSHDDVNPQVSGDRVVWRGYDGSDYEIFTWTPAGGVLQLNSDSYADYYPQVSGDRVVWAADRGVMFTWTPAGGVLQLTWDRYGQNSIQVSGDRVVWVGHDGSDFEIFTAILAPPSLAPTIKLLTPAGGPAAGGNEVVITGTALERATAVKFGSEDAAGYSVGSSTQIRAIAPGGTAGTTVDVTVTTPDGVATATHAYTYADNTAVAKPVVVLISGLDSNTASDQGVKDWAYVRSRLRSAGYETFVAMTQPGGSGEYKIDSASPYWDTSALNLDAQLRESAVKGRRVILVGHSMGGLIARAYGDLPDSSLTSGCAPVGIIQLGTPNKGSPMGVLGYWALGNFSPASKKLSDNTFMTTFNKDHRNRRPLPMYRIAGHYFPAKADTERDLWFTGPSGYLYDAISALIDSQFGQASNDSMVAVDSVRGGPPRGWVGYAAFDAVHGNNFLDKGFLRAAGAVQPYIRGGWDDTPYSTSRDRGIMNKIIEFVRDAEIRGGGTVSVSGAASLSEADSALLQAAASSTSEADLETAPGALTTHSGPVSLASGTAQITFRSEGSTAAAAVVPDAGEVSVFLATSDGTPVPCQATQTDGAWQLAAGDLTPGDQYVLTMAVVSGDPSLAVASIWDDGASSLRVVASDQVSAGESFILRAAVYERDANAPAGGFALSSAPLSATAQLESEAPLAMSDDGVAPDSAAGDGIYAAMLVAPSAASSVSVSVAALGTDSAGISFERRTSRYVTVCEPRAGFTGTPTYRTEVDGQGKVAALLIDVPISASEGCAFELSGDLSSLGELVCQGATDGTLAAGETGTITLRFEAADLYPRLDSSGAFSISRLTLIDRTDEDQAVLDEAADVLSGTLDRDTLAYTGSSLWSPGGNPLASQDVLLLGQSASPQEPAAGVEYSLDYGEWTALSDSEAEWGATEVDWSFSLNLADGLHEVVARALDGAGEAIAGSEALLSFTVDTAAPQGQLVLSRAFVEGDAHEVLASSSLSDLSGVTEMRFSLDGTEAWSDWEPYREEASLTLAAGSGPRSVYAQFRDAAGNVAELEDSLTLLSLSNGWNLVAGGPDSDFLGHTLFGYDGSAYNSLSAASTVAGSGYWCRVSTPEAGYSATTGSPVTCHLEVGWNLIGNSSGVPLDLPTGFSAFTYDGAAYQSTSVLEPGEGAWVKATAEQYILLTPSG